MQIVKGRGIVRRYQESKHVPNENLSKMTGSMLFSTRAHAIEKDAKITRRDPSLSRMLSK